MFPGKYLAGGLQSGCTANLTGVQYKCLPPGCQRRSEGLIKSAPALFSCAAFQQRARTLQRHGCQYGASCQNFALGTGKYFSDFPCPWDAPLHPSNQAGIGYRVPVRSLVGVAPGDELSHDHAVFHNPVGDDGCRVSRPVEGDYVFRSDILRLLLPDVHQAACGYGRFHASADHGVDMISEKTRYCQGKTGCRQQQQKKNSHRFQENSGKASSAAAHFRRSVPSAATSASTPQALPMASAALCV